MGKMKKALPAILLLCVTILLYVLAIVRLFVFTDPSWSDEKLLTMLFGATFLMVALSILSVTWGVIALLLNEKKEAEKKSVAKIPESSEGDIT
ncbi:hypothetical protein LJC63_11370 [Ruminococcaceae bacterium OttesenSCG-928-L11]|nr:hypothetical protein [Ruminococcaceae bacterium OttesenSCG-928-L11]